MAPSMIPDPKRPSPEESRNSINEIFRRAQINSDNQEIIEANVRNYVRDGKNFDSEAYTQDLEARCNKSPGRVKVAKRKKIVKGVLITAAILIVAAAWAYAWKYALDTSPLYGQQHNPAITQQQDGGMSHGK